MQEERWEINRASALYQPGPSFDLTIAHQKYHAQPEDKFHARKVESFLGIREVHQGGPSPNKPFVGGVCRVLATKIVSRLRFSLRWSSWQMQYMEREHAIQELKKRSCFKYFTC